jgi:hypothetical protein
MRRPRRPPACRMHRRAFFMPLSIAAAIVYRAFRVDGEPQPQTEEEMERRIEDAARTVSIAVRIFRLDLADPVPIAPTVLAEGYFAAGGRELRFTDGRPTLDALAVLRGELDRALAKRAGIIPESRPEAIIPSKFMRPRIDA